MADSQRVLVMDGLSETEEVLKAVLEPQGLEVQRVHASPAVAASSYNDRTPAVVVCHADEETGTYEASSWDDVPRIIIGSARLPAPEIDPTNRDRFLRNPFDYRDLVSEIESLLGFSRPS